MASYKPKSTTITATNINNGGVMMASLMTLAQWGRSLFHGFVKNASGVVVTNAAVEVIRVATTGSTSLGTIFTNAHGEYGVSLAVLTGGQSYRFDSYIPF